MTNASEQRGPAEPGAPTATPRARPNQSALPQPTGPASSSPAGLQGSAGLNGSGPLQELMTHMESGQLGHKMNDSDIHDQLVSLLLLHYDVCMLNHTAKATVVQLSVFQLRQIHTWHARKKRKVDAGRHGLWETLDRPMVSRHLTCYKVMGLLMNNRETRLEGA